MENSTMMEWMDGGMKRRTRLERAEAKSKEWWTDHLQMDWMENGNEHETVSNKHIFEQECGTAPPILSAGEVACQSGSDLCSTATAKLKQKKNKQQEFTWGWVAATKNTQKIYFEN